MHHDSTKLERSCYHIKQREQGQTVSPFSLYKFSNSEYHTLTLQQHPPTAMLILLCIYSRRTASSMSHQQIVPVT